MNSSALLPSPSLIPSSFPPVRRTWLKTGFCSAWVRARMEGARVVSLCLFRPHPATPDSVQWERRSSEESWLHWYAHYPLWRHPYLIWNVGPTRLECMMNKTAEEVSAADNSGSGPVSTPTISCNNLLTSSSKVYSFYLSSSSCSSSNLSYFPPPSALLSLRKQDLTA